jgi:hypothetical protein
LTTPLIRSYWGHAMSSWYMKGLHVFHFICCIVL